MSNPLPVLFANPYSSQLQYGFTKQITCPTVVNTFMNAAEQRWVAGVPLVRFVVPLTALLDADRTNYLTFFSAVQGRFRQNVTIAADSTTYSNLTLESDTLAFTNTRPLQYETWLSFRQVSNWPYTIPSAAGTYPQLAFGTGGGIAVAERPFTDTSVFLTSVSDSPFGQRFAYSWYGSSSAFPSSYLKAWRISYPLLTDADATTIEQYFLGVQGRYQSFTFPNPIDSTNYGNCRFDADTLVRKYIGFNQNQMEVSLIQTNNS